MKNIINEDYTPRRATERSAGYDIFANDNFLVTSKPKLIDTGIVIEDDDFFYRDNVVGMVFPRSSMGFKHGLRFVNTVGIIDMDYRDTIKLKLFVDSEYPNFWINKGERYAQLIFTNFCTVFDEIIPTDKRTGGIGSTTKDMNEDFTYINYS